MKQKAETTTESKPIRTCSGCGTTFPKHRLVRFVLSPEGSVELDVTGKLPGRGAYLFPNRSCFEQADKRKGFARSFKNGNYRFDCERLFKTLERSNRERLLNDIRLAKKAGAIVTGSNNVDVAIRAKTPLLVLLADDASANTKKKYSEVANSRNFQRVEALPMDVIGHVLGSAPRAVVAVTHVVFAKRIEEDAWIYAAIQGRVHCQNTR